MAFRGGHDLDMGLNKSILRSPVWSWPGHNLSMGLNKRLAPKKRGERSGGKMVVDPTNRSGEMVV